jgi:hypothetical protein
MMLCVCVRVVLAKNYALGFNYVFVVPVAIHIV